MKGKNRSWKPFTITVWILVILALVLYLAVWIAHGIVMKGLGYEKYDDNIYLLYEDVEKEYPRERFQVKSGDNRLSAYLYGKGNEKGMIVVAPGHGDSNDIKLYEIRYFVDAGYEVVCFDYTGYFTSEGDNFGGYSQAVYDLDAVLSYIEDKEVCRDKPLYLFGHSQGGYAAGAVLNMGHDVDAVVSASGFDNPGDQWQCSIQRFTSIFYPVMKPFTSLFIQVKYGKDKDLSAVSGINSVDIPVLVISAEEDVFYGGKKSPIYDKKDEITNSKCSFWLMDEENHNHHYDYFLTDAALEYQKSNPTGTVDKELYMQHDEKFMEKIVAFLEESRKDSIRES